MNIEGDKSGVGKYVLYGLKRRNLINEFHPYHFSWWNHSSLPVVGESEGSLLSHPVNLSFTPKSRPKPMVHVLYLSSTKLIGPRYPHRHTGGSPGTSPVVQPETRHISRRDPRVSPSDPPFTGVTRRSSRTLHDDCHPHQTRCRVYPYTVNPVLYVAQVCVLFIQVECTPPNFL